MTLGACTNCGSKRQFRSKKDVSAGGGGYAPNYLPRLGSRWAAPKFHVVVCYDCGLTRFFAPAEAREKMSRSEHWQRVG